MAFLDSLPVLGGWLTRASAANSAIQGHTGRSLDGTIGLLGEMNAILCIVTLIIRKDAIQHWFGIEFDKHNGDVVQTRKGARKVVERLLKLKEYLFCTLLAVGLDNLEGFLDAEGIVVDVHSLQDTVSEENQYVSRLEHDLLTASILTMPEHPQRWAAAIQ